VKINKKVDNLIDKNKRLSKNWILNYFKYDGYASPLTNSSSTSSATSSSNNSNNTLGNRKPKSLGIFATYLLYNKKPRSLEAFAIYILIDNYKLYYSWTMDSRTNTYVSNDASRSN
jgi:hypothetical protein